VNEVMETDSVTSDLATLPVCKGLLVDTRLFSTSSDSLESRSDCFRFFLMRSVQMNDVEVLMLYYIAIRTKKSDTRLWKRHVPRKKDHCQSVPFVVLLILRQTSRTSRTTFRHCIRLAMLSSYLFQFQYFNTLFIRLKIK